ncbi:MAG: hypothetical protein Q9170_006927 [Blastenia crenularia]
MPPLNFLLRHCNPTDIPSLAILNATCFTAAANTTIHRSVPPASRLAFIESGFRDHFNYPTSPTSSVHPQEIHILAIIDTSTSAIISHAIWTYFPIGYRADTDIQLHHSYLPPGINGNLLSTLDQRAGEHRSSHALRHESHWLLATLGTHPDYEGKGAGGMLIRWGLEKADEMGKRCFVDSSARGLDLYKKFGFEEVGAFEVALKGGNEKEGEESQRWVALMREPK